MKTKNTINNALVLAVCLILLLVAGCSKTEKESKLEKQTDQAWKACIDTGGAPIRSAWSSQMADCKYPTVTSN